MFLRFVFIALIYHIYTMTQYTTLDMANFFSYRCVQSCATYRASSRRMKANPFFLGEIEDFFLIPLQQDADNNILYRNITR
jgi:predicted tellurium resistance membrane protein TerC